ncbi:putative ankyrin repeat protein RF_0381 [Stegodyphus dumicola]|uniref:putative ankyrin repeat protein RF_0381 n=1 Tax=Stegodyphus dumicola TaxID=202533 RepID=UPI0015A9CD31|nr:putative ankyrin repeat protein RF_0381 [Stegodyphus dumicola]
MGSVKWVSTMGESKMEKKGVANASYALRSAVVDAVRIHNHMAVDEDELAIMKIQINHSYGIEGTALMRAVKEAASETARAANSAANESYSFRDLCMLLIGHGCNVNAVNIFGESALHFAVQTKQEELVLKLIISGSNIDRLDSALCL